MAKEREERLSLVEKMSKLENQLKERGQMIGEFTESAAIMDWNTNLSLSLSPNRQTRAAM